MKQASLIGSSVSCSVYARPYSVVALYLIFLLLNNWHVKSYACVVGWCGWLEVAGRHKCEPQALALSKHLTCPRSCVTQCSSFIRPHIQLPSTCFNEVVLLFCYYNKKLITLSRCQLFSPWSRYCLYFLSPYCTETGRHYLTLSPSLLSQLRHHGECICELIQRPVWEERDEDSNGWARCGWKNNYSI